MLFTIHTRSTRVTNFHRAASSSPRVRVQAERVNLCHRVTRAIAVVNMPYAHVSDSSWAVWITDRTREISARNTLRGSRPCSNIFYCTTLQEEKYLIAHILLRVNLNVEKSFITRIHSAVLALQRLHSCMSHIHKDLKSLRRRLKEKCYGRCSRSAPERQVWMIRGMNSGLVQQRHLFSNKKRCKMVPCLLFEHFRT